ncbi:MAG: SDR family NAD(P)-dependent oxidoreductase [Chloroflexi bacterium]|nr:SDR family NAD(P)-dependent oxidoreductase [Chloroflexota bacterium]
MAKRALLTGASGFVGANLTRRLLTDGHEVHLLLRPAHHGWRLEDIQADVRVHIVDLSDREDVEQAVRAIRPDWLFHLAAHGAYSSQTGLRQMVDTNLVGTIDLVEAALAVGFEAFVNTGSSSEYGFKDHAPPETEWIEPNSHYAVTKASATLFCRYTAQRRDVHLVTLRLYSAYGPFEEPTRLMPAFAVHGLAGRLPPLVDPSIARDYVYVDDVSDAYVLAATRPDQERGAVYNVGTGVQTSLGELVDIVRRVLNVAVEPRWGSMPDRQWDTSTWVANSQAIRDRLGWQPRYDVEAGFRHLVNWLAAHPDALAYYRTRLGLDA